MIAYIFVFSEELHDGKNKVTASLTTNALPQETLVVRELHVVHPAPLHPTAAPHFFKYLTPRKPGKSPYQREILISIHVGHS